MNTQLSPDSPLAQPVSTPDSEYFRSAGGGQFFRRTGESVVVVCTYDFNPSVERTHFSQQLLDRLLAEPCTEADYLAARKLADSLIDANLPSEHTSPQLKRLLDAVTAETGEFPPRPLPND